MLNKRDWKEYNRQVEEYNQSVLHREDRGTYTIVTPIYPFIEKSLTHYLDWVANGKPPMVRKLEVISK